MKNLFRLTILALFVVTLVSCNNDDDATTNDPVTIAGFVANNSDYSSLAAALERAGLTATLNGQGSFTVFAPNNAAFSAFLSANGFATLNDVPVDVLTQVLLNHVIDGVTTSQDLTTGYVNTLAVYASSTNNLSMYVDTTSGVRLNGISTVTSADISASNGVIHAVDTVIALPTVVTFATADPTFDTLVAALTRTDQPDFVAVLTTAQGTAPAPFTVFAPTNTAFENLLTELGVAGLNDIDGPTLTATLNTHVIAGANVRAEDLTTGTVSTLGADLVVDATNATLTDPNGRVSTIIVTNVQASNGVVHAIDTVVLPEL
tara:strand:+ start:37697 stop:38650 length:954 start_codon:yes stop_codon:yes gene_type:complete